MIAGRSVLFLADYEPSFSGDTYRGAGVGGTQAMIVLLAEEIARRGATVTVANRTRSETHAAGVRYVPAASLGTAGSDLVVLTKQWSDAADGRGRLRVFLCPDIHVEPAAQLERCRDWAHACFAGSDFNRERVERATGRGTVRALGWPVDVDAYAAAVSRRERVLLYCSVPDRGLYYLKDIFPRVRREVPDARLLITSDFTLWGRGPARGVFEAFFRGQDGVEYLGHVDRTTLVDAQCRARVMAYPCNFPEGFCLAAAECMAAGTVPVTTNAFALTTTVGESGVLVRGRPRSWLYRRAFTRALVRLLTDDAAWESAASACRRRARSEFHPRAVVDRLFAFLDPFARTVWT